MSVPRQQTPRRPSALGGSQRRHQQTLPFANDAVEDSDLSRDIGDSPRMRDRARSVVASAAEGSANALSSSYRTPARSFFHHASYGTTDNPQYSSHGVREKTQELAHFALSDDESYRRGARRMRSSTSQSDTSLARENDLSSLQADEDSSSSDVARGNVANEDSEQAILNVSAEESQRPGQQLRSSYTLWRDSARGRGRSSTSTEASSSRSKRLNDPPAIAIEDADDIIGESRPLLPKSRHSSETKQDHLSGNILDVTRRRSKIGWNHVKRLAFRSWNHGMSVRKTLKDPHTWSRRNLARGGLDGLKMLSAVFLGLLLNILDGLSYGLILFPLGEPVFSQTGPDGISIFFVSCIVSQVVYSGGASIFRGGVGSELIEVIPFFHKMAYGILAQVGSSKPEAVLATVIVAYAMSSILTGLIFLALGLLKLGSLVSFFPRNILTGCVGGVGFFLVVTGIEVSARLDGNLDYSLETLSKLFEADTVVLWLLPLLLSILIIVIRHFFKSPLILPTFFVVVVAVFFIIVKAICRFDLDTMRQSGWIFPRPETGVPFYRFYSYFKFGLVDWNALSTTVPTMFALSFFGIIHVPINVPALGVAVREDDVNINRELIAHGLSNTISGGLGSIQNYLAYANSVLFIDNGGNSRVAGILLAVATTAVWVAGPGMIGFIPVCVVGTLIFMLGFELLIEAVWEPFGKLHKLEYLTIIAIVLIMGAYDFVVGIVAGIVLACLNYVVQSSRTPAIRAVYTGDIAESTVRRPRLDRRYLAQVRSQICVHKLSGYLFFGTIVAVEQEMRALIDEESFERKPIRYVIVDFIHVTGIDFSAAEAFTRINRILCRRNVKMIVSGVSFSDEVGKSLAMVGLLDAEKADDECPSPRVYEDLNYALEACENELLEHFYQHRWSTCHQVSPPMPISPKLSSTAAEPNFLDAAWQSPRHNLLDRAAANMIEETGADAVSDGTTNLVPSKWKHFAQPVKIMLQTFEGISDQNEDFWHRAAPFFSRREYARGAVLYSRGDTPDGFYILESGRFRAEYELEQGSFSEVILPGTTCGELPFFSETDRTGTVAAEEDCVAWLLTREAFRDMEGREPAITAELLRIGLKLTSERMSAITSYVLVTAT